MINALKRNWFKIVVLIILVFIALIINSYFQNKQASIRAHEARELELKEKELEQDHITERRKACLDIYKQESSKWNNVEGFEYDSEDDICYISYKDPKYWQGKNCAKQMPDESISAPILRKIMVRNWMNCLGGLFEKQF